ncbi:MAG: DNA repair protein RecN [Ignavibacteria bacterium]|nr:DNA repair protein RecN [Ignavibacteria bacterium]
MIERLLIRNYLIIKDAEIGFSKGFNILTGETGAGKSIILDALALILGERADYSLIRKDADKLVVEGHFEFAEDDAAIGLLRRLLPEDCINGGSVIIRRELLKKGSGRTFINDYPVNISDLKKFGDAAIDIHSQNEHQSLLSKETHIRILDGFAGNDALRNAYSEAYARLSDLIREYEGLVMRKDEFVRRRSFVEFELKEINNLNPQPGEDEELENELKKMENSEVISVAVNNSISLLYENEQSILSGIDQAVKELRKVSAYDTEFEKITEELLNCEVLIKECSATLMSYREGFDFDPGRINEVRERLSAVRRMLKKHGSSVSGLIEKGKELERELNIADNYDYELQKALERVKTEYAGVMELAVKLSKVRKKAAKELEKGINSILTETGLESAEFRVELKTTEELISPEFVGGGNVLRPRSDGTDDIEFLIKINKGTDFSPLRKSASGGEISRIMLAIKTVLSGKDDVGILVFDEIDAGISGRIAQKVGKLMKNLSRSRQIICITHLPQIAAMSDTHFRVSKEDVTDGTIANIEILSESEKITEVAKLISGENITESASRSAKELISGI